MESGKLDRKITINQKSVSRDAMGGETVSMVLYKTIWASFRPSRNSEKIESDEVTATRVCEFTFRYHDAPLTDESMEIVLGSDTYQIMGVQFLGRNETIKAITKLKV